MSLLLSQCRLSVYPGAKPTMDDADATMKCALVKEHGGKDAFDEIIFMSEAWPRPKLRC